jgi:ATP-binding cassette, subfamily F, member 3
MPAADDAAAAQAERLAKLTVVDVAATCAEVLAGLDEDVLEYITETAAPDGGPLELEKEDFEELVVPMLVDAELCEDDDAAQAKFEELWSKLTAGGGGAAAEEASAPKLLTGKVSLKAQAREYEEAAAKQAAHFDSGVQDVLNKEIDTSKVDDVEDGGLRDPKAEANAAARCERLTAEVVKETESLEQEMAAAREAAAQMRTDGQGGAGLGAIETGTFDLPNPGGGADLLSNAAVVLVPGRRYGLIGRNGKGKSTMLKYLAARRVGGLPASLSIHYVSQTCADMGELEVATPGEVVIQADTERAMLMAQVATLDKLSTPNEEQHAQLEAAQERLEEIGADGAPGRVASLLKNLGFSEELLGRSVKDLSGGWRVRVALAAALFAQPDLLLMDEPTNHLSIEAVLWLQRELTESQTWQKRIVVTVSHDRAFLDEVCTDVMHISGVARRLTQERGNYTMCAKRRDKQKKAWLEKCKKREMAMDHLKEFIGRGGTYANVSVQRKMKEEQLAKMVEEHEAESLELAALQEDEELSLRLMAGGMLDQAPIQVVDVSFGYPGTGRTLFEGAEFGVHGGSRIVLLGENGNGKTTLVKLMMGELEPVTGEVRIASGVRVALVNQHHADQIDLNQTPLFYLRQLYRGDGSRDHEQKLRAHLTSCGVANDLQLVPARAMSGGQRSRLAMAAVSYGKPHVLILDEPTNNLDLEAVEALAATVETFDGGVVIVSHDQYFVSRVAKEVMLVGDGAVRKLESFDKYIEAAHKRAAA